MKREVDVVYTKLYLKLWLVNYVIIIPGATLSTHRLFLKSWKTWTSAHEHGESTLANASDTTKFCTKSIIVPIYQIYKPLISLRWGISCLEFAVSPYIEVWKELLTLQKRCFEVLSAAKMITSAEQIKCPKNKEKNI